MYFTTLNGEYLEQFSEKEMKKYEKISQDQGQIDVAKEIIENLYQQIRDKKDSFKTGKLYSGIHYDGGFYVVYRKNINPSIDDIIEQSEKILR